MMMITMAMMTAMMDENEVVTSSSSISNTTSNITSSSTSPSSSFSSIFTNYPLVSALIAFTIAQSAKLITTWYKEKRWDAKQLVASGGMPSSHSTTVTALAFAVGFRDGFRGSLFAVAMILASVKKAFNTRTYGNSPKRPSFYRNLVSLSKPIQESDSY